MDKNLNQKTKATDQKIRPPAGDTIEKRDQSLIDRAAHYDKDGQSFSDDGVVLATDDQDNKKPRQ